MPERTKPPVRVIDWGGMPRLLSELCDGHPGYVTEAYRLVLPNGVTFYMCKSCWLRTWIERGRPEQPVGKDGGTPNER